MLIKADATGEETSTYDDDCVEPIDFSSIKQGMFIAVDKEEWSQIDPKLEELKRF